jgi:small basic protein (TIGR04137 family)
MSIDPSLKVRAGALGHRSVLTRAERLEKLKKARKWNEGDRVLGLPKVRTVFKQKGKKKAEKPKAEAAAGATPAEGAAAAPAAEAAPEKKGKK